MLALCNARVISCFRLITVTRFRFTLFRLINHHETRGGNQLARSNYQFKKRQKELKRKKKKEEKRQRKLDRNAAKSIESEDQSAESDVESDAEGEGEEDQ